MKVKRIYNQEGQTIEELIEDYINTYNKMDI